MDIDMFYVLHHYVKLMVVQQFDKIGQLYDTQSMVEDEFYDVPYSQIQY
ncbi:hypothetical protein LDVICp182 [lymphocystis disease virus-China]|uniref:Uncharacterized protein n=1 Tax=lymphocystis disease virus-China TaxID=256729 RepID=Q677T1_9VIRU|nr:hypothetical protein LDVICp182 [lymphocystis disease virus-China]AAU11026.1 hypothetical protein [lymphocystis disease virus-China]